MKKIFRPFLAALATAVIIVPLIVSTFAANGTTHFYLNPATQSLAIGDALTVQIRLGTDQQIGYVKTYLDFPANLLSVANISTTNTDFEAQIEQSYDNTGGTVKIARTGNQRPGILLVASVTFITKSSGNAIVSFEGSTWASSAQYFPNQVTGKTNGSYFVGSQTPAPTPPPTPTPTHSPTPAPKPTAKPTPSPVGPTSIRPPNVTPTANNPIGDPGKLSINSVTILPSYNNAVASWVTTFASACTFVYGTSPDNLSNSQVLDQKQTIHRISMTALEPGKKYYYRISAKTDKDQQAEYDGDFSTTGYPVKIVLRSSSKKLVNNAGVTIDDATLQTGQDGTAPFNLSEGTHPVIISANGRSKNTSLKVSAKDIPTDGSEPEVQFFSFTIPSANPLPWIFSVIVLAGLASAVVVFLRSKRRKKTVHHSHENTVKVNKPHEQEQSPKATALHVLKHAKAAVSARPPSPAKPKPATVPIPAPAPPPLPKSQPLPKPPVIPPLPELPGHPAIPPVPVSPPPAQPVPHLGEHESLPDMVKRTVHTTPPKVVEEEPKDMFDLAEEQYHYDEKFKKPPK